LTLPRGIALDRHLRVYLLDRQRGVILRHNPGAPGYDPDHPFRELPAVGNQALSGTAADNPRRFAGATALAADHDSLYVVDGASRRVLVFALDSWALRDVWGCWDSESPQDVIAHPHGVYVLTTGAIYRSAPGCSAPVKIISRADGAPDWTRFAADTSDLLYVLPAGAPASLLVFDPLRRQRVLPDVTTSSAVRDRFRVPAVYTIPNESASGLQYVMPEPLTRACGRTWPVPPPGRTIEVYLTHRPRGPGDGFVFDEHGARVAPEKVQFPRTRLFLTGVLNQQGDWAGEWISTVLDGRVYGCRWDAIALDFADLPHGCRVELSTSTADAFSSVAAGASVPPTPDAGSAGWALGLSATGPPRSPTADPRIRTDFLVNSPPGQYLWLRIRFRGDGFSTPVLSGLTVRFPRRSYLEHLPAVFSEDEAGRRFLERFLAIFQAEWDQLETRVDELAGVFDPNAVGVVAPDFIDYLAGWLGVSFENGLSNAAKQQILKRLPCAFFAPRQPDTGQPGGSRRGTPAALRGYVGAVLYAVSGADPIPGGFPFVIDGYRDRDYRLLPADCSPAVAPTGTERARPGAPLWSPTRVPRFQLGVASRLDEESLIPASDPDLDVFRAHAHRFRVVVPAAWLRTAAAEASVRRVIEAEKPAHTQYELTRVEPAMRVGIQSTLGVDTILGGSDTRLTADGLLLGGADGLGGEPGPGAARLDAGLRLGIDPGRI
jgi:phage tail-like protein